MKLQTESLTIESDGDVDADSANLFYPPQFTTGARPTAAAALEGMIIYNTTTNKLNICTGGAWEAVTSST